MTRIGGVVLCGGRSSRMGRPKAWLPVGDEVMLQRVVRVLRTVASPVVVVAAPGQELPELPDDVTVTRDEVEGKGPLGGLAAGLAAIGFPVPATEAVLEHLPSWRGGRSRSDREGRLALDTTPLPADERALTAPTSPPRGEVEDRVSPPVLLSPTFGAAVKDRPDAVYLSACDVPFLTPEFVTAVASFLTPDVDIVVPAVGGYTHPLAAVYRTSVAGEVAKLLAADRLRMTDLFDAVRTRRLTEAELPDVESLRNVNTPEEYAAVLAVLKQD